MSSDDTERDSSALAEELATLRQANDRLQGQLHRLVRDLESRADVDVRVDLDAPPEVPMVRVAPVVRAVLDPEAATEVHEVAARLALIQRDLRRIEQQIEKLLWRTGGPPPPLALG